MKAKSPSHAGVRFDTDGTTIPFSEIKLRKILVPTDFTACSHKALSYALSFARLFGAEILLLHVVESVPTIAQDAMLQSSMLNAALHEESKKRLHRWQREAMADGSVETMTADGVPWQRIVEVAREKNMDLIVAGTGGRSGLALVLLGSTAERVVRHAPCPVLVVREREHEFLASEIAEEEGETALV
ncbi:MAG TPA: universal stress protein [Verrucomicrobiae bacterium]|jgi:nucleotide-binding universal stress UspA family protein